MAHRKFFIISGIIIRADSGMKKYLQYPNFVRNFAVVNHVDRFGCLQPLKKMLKLQRVMALHACHDSQIARIARRSFAFFLLT